MTSAGSLTTRSTSGRPRSMSEQPCRCSSRSCRQSQTSALSPALLDTCEDLGSRPAAFPALQDAFGEWASKDPAGDAAWALGDALATAASIDDLPVLLEIVQDNRYGNARRMVVEALWRFRKDARVGPVLDSLVEDRAVSLHAMSAFRRTVGNRAALPRLRHVRDEHPDALVRKQAAVAVQRAEKAAR